MKSSGNYLWINGAKAGPFTFGQLKAMWQNGQITGETHFWSDDLSGWQMLGLRIEDKIAEEKCQTQNIFQVRQEPAYVPRPGDIVCPNTHCHYCGPPKKVARGSAILGILLMFFFVLPGVLYLMFMSGYNYVCPKCGMHLRSGPHT
ncbi:MAG: DUF4339 domain-containing protein [Verrucomicrobiota bacterium]